MTAIDRILSFYSAQPKGVQENLKKILDHGTLGGTGKLVILPVDQGVEHGPTKSFSKNPEGYSPQYHAQFAVDSGCNAYAAPLGFIESVSEEYNKKIPLILKLNHSDSLYQDKEAPMPALVADVKRAKQLGCVGVGFTIYPGSQKRQEQYEQLAQVIREAREAGLVAVVWSYPRGTIESKYQTAVDVVAYAAHIACQLGAHIIKVKPPTKEMLFPATSDGLSASGIPSCELSDCVKHVVQSCFNGQRIVIFSGGTARGTEDFLKEIQALKDGGAFGSIIGRNAFQRPKKEALELLKKVMNIYGS